MTGNKPVSTTRRRRHRPVGTSWTALFATRAQIVANAIALKAEGTLRQFAASDAQAVGPRVRSAALDPQSSRPHSHKVPTAPFSSGTTSPNGSNDRNERRVLEASTCRRGHLPGRLASKRS